MWLYEHGEIVKEIIIKFRPGVEPRPRALVGRRLVAELSGLAGVRLKAEALVLAAEDFQALRLPKNMTVRAAEEICKKLRQHPDVLTADASTPAYPLAINPPDDPFYRSGRQWALGGGPGAAAVAGAWDLTTGSADTVVAILDSGLIRRQVNGQWQYHEDLQARTILPGYDFISDAVCAGDNDGRDADFTDEGDAASPTLPSSWHGTQIAGIVAATTNNGVGVAGIDWRMRILPVRILGRCSYLNQPQDIADAILWAAGIDIGAPALNTNPARVINLSFGASAGCPAVVQTAIDRALARGSVLVAAAGNSGLMQSFYPAGCKGVIAVLALGQDAKRWPGEQLGLGYHDRSPGCGDRVHGRRQSSKGTRLR
jgi:serine protease